MHQAREGMTFGERMLYEVINSFKQVMVPQLVMVLSFVPHG
jgi:hypothetical protein